MFYDSEAEWDSFMNIIYTQKRMRQWSGHNDDKSRKAIFGLQKKVKFSNILPPEMRFEMLDTMIKPILTYSSDVWGINKNALHELDRVFFKLCSLCFVCKINK